MQRKELVAANHDKQQQQPISIHLHHTAHRAKAHVDLRGPAASSRRTLVARPVSVLAAELRTLIERHHCVCVVVGLPLTLEYTLDAQCHKTMLFVEAIRQEWNKPTTRNAAEAQRLMQQAHANMLAAEAEFSNQGKRKQSTPSIPRPSSKAVSARRPLSLSPSLLPRSSGGMSV